MKKQRPVLIACVSDIHSGSTVAICPPVISLDDGGEYHASRAQSWLWSCWLAYWERVAEVQREHGADLYVVLNGDLVEGDHHRTVQILSGNLQAQAAVIDAALKVPLALSPSKIWVVRGTEAHVGQSASAEESIAKGLRKDKRPIVSDIETGTASTWHLRMEIHGKLIDVAHHGRTGQREHTRGSAAVLHAHDILLSYIKSGDRPPDLCLRAHYHKFNDSGDSCPTRVVTTGAWQLATGHVRKVATDSIADIGGAIVLVREGRALDVEKVKFQAARSPVWRKV